MEHSLVASEIAVTYGRVHAVRDMTLRVHRGNSFVVVGPNGAGKTSLLKALAGAVRISSGTIVWSGRRIEKSSTGSRAKLGIGFVPDRDVVFPSMTVWDNLRLGADAVGKKPSDQTIDSVLELFPVLHGRRRQNAGTLSGGERRMLAIGRALVVGANLLILDEPSAGLAVAVQQALAEAICNLHEHGVATIVAEQNLRFAENLGGVATLMDRGVQRWSGATATLLRSDEVEEAIVGRGIYRAGAGA